MDQLYDPPGADHLLVTCTLHGHGTAWFDDLTLRERSPLDGEEIGRRWEGMSRRGEWLLTAHPHPAVADGLPLAPPRAWEPGGLYGWMILPPTDLTGQGLALAVPLEGLTPQYLRPDVPPGEYTLHLWLGGDSGARVPLKLSAGGQCLAERLLPFSPQVYRYPVSVSADGLVVTLEGAARPVPVGPTAPAPPLRAVAVTRLNAKPSQFDTLVETHDAVLEAGVSPVPTRRPDVSASPALLSVYATEVSPTDLGSLVPDRPLTLVGAPGETLAGGALVMAEPGRVFRAELAGDLTSVETRLGVGVPGWVRLSGWDSWASPAKWVAWGPEGLCSSEGLGLVWLQVRLPTAADPVLHSAQLRVSVAGTTLRLPVRVEVLPLELPEPNAHIGMFYNATLHLSCPDDELYGRWHQHLAHMRAHGMNSVFIYTFRMLWSRQEENGWRWDDEPLRDFLGAHAQFFAQPLYLFTHGDRFHPQGYAQYCRHVMALAQEAGVEVAFMPVDEAFASEDLLRDAQGWVQQVKEAGGRVAMTTDQTEA